MRVPPVRSGRLRLSTGRTGRIRCHGPCPAVAPPGLAGTSGRNCTAPDSGEGCCSIRRCPSFGSAPPSRLRRVTSLAQLAALAAPCWPRPTGTVASRMLRVRVPEARPGAPPRGPGGTPPGARAAEPWPGFPSPATPTRSRTEHTQTRTLSDSLTRSLSLGPSAGSTVQHAASSQTT